MTKEEMNTIYKPNGYDWMNSKYNSDSELASFNLIDFNNMVFNTILTKDNYKKFKSLEYENIDLYHEYEWLFYAIYLSNTNPSYAYIEMMNELNQERLNLVRRKNG